MPQTSPPRDEPFDVTYRCSKPMGHDGPCGDADILDGIGEHEPLDLESIKARHQNDSGREFTILSPDADPSPMVMILQCHKDREALIAEVEYLRAAADLDAETRDTPTECGACGNVLVCQNCARRTFARTILGAFVQRVNARAEADIASGNPVEVAHYRALTAEVEAMKP